MDQKKTGLAVSIVHMNNSKILENCLKSIYEHPPSIPFKVFVIDNGSSDGSQDMVKKRFPQVHLIENGMNIGFSRCNNMALRRSRNSKYFLLLNNDTIILPGSFDNMINFMEEHPDCGISGIKLLFPNGKVQSCKFTFPTLLKEFFHAHVLIKNILAKNKKLMWNLRKAYYSLQGEKKAKEMLDYDTTQEVDDVLGACFLVRMKAIDQIGVFDQDYFFCREESDYAIRAKRKGWKVYYNSEATIIHIGGATAKRLNIAYYCQDKISANFFLKKHYSLLKRLLFKLIIFEAFCK